MKKIRSLVSILLTAVILAAGILPAAATGMEKEEQYHAAILQLEKWLETPGYPAEELEQIASAFRSLDGYQMSPQFDRYSNVLLKAVQGNFDGDYRNGISELETDEKFRAYIQSDVSNPDTFSVPNMLCYAKGREAELKGDATTAAGLYAEAGSFCDAGERYETLARDIYSQARKMINEKDLRNAYHLFSAIRGYSDSAVFMEYVIHVLHYDPAHEHEWTEATCTGPRVCSICGDEEGEALGHDWSEATCTEAKTCSRCGSTEGEALGHEWSEATCTEAKTCSRCGATEGEALGHEWSEATCTEAKICRRCGATEGEALGHDWSEATCTEVKTCRRCGATEGEALGHDWQAATCTEMRTCIRCGLTDGEALGHDWQEATCTEAKTCSRCGATDGEPLGHDWSEATCTEAKTCGRCGTTDGEPLGHDWEEATFVDPEICRRCGVEGNGRVIPRNAKKPFVGVVTVSEGERKAIRRTYEEESEILLWAQPGARYASYNKVGKKSGSTWYRIWVPEEDDWGWISSYVSELTTD